MEKRIPRNIFDADEATLRIPLGIAGDMSKPEAAATKLVENRFRTTGLEVISCSEGLGGAWDVLLKRTTSAVYDAEAIYYRVTCSPRIHQVIIEMYRVASRVRLEEAYAETILDREN